MYNDRTWRKEVIAAATTEPVYLGPPVEDKELWASMNLAALA